MKSALIAFFSGAKAEFIQLKRSPFLIILTIIQAITFIFLVNFFGTTGAFAPTALVDYDKGVYSKKFIQNLQDAHHSFDLKFMDTKSATDAINKGNVVAIITIPKGFSEAISQGKLQTIKVVVNNIDTDMTADIKRALPSAITRFGQDLNLPGIHVEAKESDLINHDTGFIPYLMVSALVLSAFIISGILGAVAVAQEFELGTILLLVSSPVRPLIPLLGRIMTTSVISVFAMLVAVLIVVLGHGVYPVHPLEMFFALLFCIIIFGCIGAALGAAMKRTLPVASLVFGISLPLYLFSGAYEPERFDGSAIWGITHFFPIYYAVGIMEHAVLDLKVTPESVFVNFLALFGFAVLALLTAGFFLRRAVS